MQHELLTPQRTHEKDSADLQQPLSWEEAEEIALRIADGTATTTEVVALEKLQQFLASQEGYSG